MINKLIWMPIFLVFLTITFILRLALTAFTMLLTLAIAPFIFVAAVISSMSTKDD